MNERTYSGFRVRGFDDRHDRAEKHFDACSSEEQAAREYIREYLEDWRGGPAEEASLTLCVWSASSTEAGGRSFSACMRNLGSPDFKVELQPND